MEQRRSWRTAAESSGPACARARFYAPFSHPARLAMLEILLGGERTVSDLMACLGMQQSHVSIHLMVLRQAGLVHARRQGRHVFYGVADGRVGAALALTAAGTDAGADAGDREARASTSPGRRVADERLAGARPNRPIALL